MVVLEGGAIDARSLETAVASCNEVLTAQQCTAGPAAHGTPLGSAAEAASPSPRSRAEEPRASTASPASAQGDAFYVSLRSDAALSSVTIEVHRGAPDGPLSHARELVFEPNTERAERARTIGLVVAAHVLAVREREHAAVPSLPPSSAPERTFRLDIAPFVGAALDAGPPRGGLALRGSMLAPTLPLGLSASVRGSYRPGQPRVSWLGAALGVLAYHQFGSAPLAVEGRLEAVGQRTDVRAKDGSLREKSSAFRLGGQLGGELLLRVARSGWLFAGAEGSLLRPRVDIRLRGRVVGSEPLWGWTVLLGARTQW